MESSLSFPLLKKLTQEGDPQAKRAFKEEIAKRLMRGDVNITYYLIDEKYLEFLTVEEISSIFSSEKCLLFENIFNTFKTGYLDRRNEADSVYSTIGKYMTLSVKNKLQKIVNTENVEDLYTLFNYMMLDELSDETIISLFNPPMNLLEKILIILNKIDYKDIKIRDYGLISKRVEKTLGNRIKKI